MAREIGYIEASEMVEFFELGNWRRSHTAGELSAANLGEQVTLFGWVNKCRDLGGLVFIDLRDRYGLTQTVVDENAAAELRNTAKHLRAEFVIGIRGTVRPRPEGQVNAQMATGKIEVVISELRTYNASAVLPFAIDEHTDAGETLRLRYRYLELRRTALKEQILGRIRFTRAMRAALEKRQFLDFETPYLYKSTPEGAREFLVPSRVHPGQFYALPQSPQLFKQLLMVSGFDRYYQVVRCFRDEDLRADRQPEFTQIDCEMSFATFDLVLETFEAAAAEAASDLLGRTITAPFPRMKFSEAMNSYGVDKPDTRFGMLLHDVSEEAGKSEFRVFRDALAGKGIVNALVAVGAAEATSRAEIDALTEMARGFGAKGLAWAKVKKAADAEGPWQSPIAKFLQPELMAAVNARVGAKAGDLILFAAGDYDTVKATLGGLRNHLGARHGLIPNGVMNFLWVVDFPLFERDNASGRLLARHHPFTRPLEDDVHLLDSDPLAVRAAAYDLVLNGHEVAGGSMRIHRPDMQKRVFAMLGLSDEEAKAKFGFLLEALTFGAPPHAGIAFGLDRLIMCLLGTDAIRDVIPFPKTSKAACLMTGSPAPVSTPQLDALHIRLAAAPAATKGAEVAEARESHGE